MNKKKILLVLPLFIFFFLTIVFFRPFVFFGNLPIPSDTILGLYYPFRDLYAKTNPNGIPFKNFLITDPVRQQYPWRQLSISIEKKLQLPLWNPYSFSGTPLLRNFQTGAFYPLNIFFWLLPFSLAWSLLIIVQPVLAGLFLYIYLCHLKINKYASTIGALVFAFCGFNVAWLEWNTIGHVLLWLPLMLLAIDKIVKENNKKKYWCAVLIFSLVSSFFAGHLQTFFYVFIIQLVHFLSTWIACGKNKKVFISFFILYFSFFILTEIQWIPTLQFILLSARDSNQQNWQMAGWFIPWEHLVQFIAPDFFGNPTTLNYWGVWNYGEFIGYIGILPLIMAIFCLFFRRDKKTLFFGSAFFLSLLFALPTVIGQIPFMLHIPFLSTAQPTRLLSIVDFSLAVLCGLGIDYFLKNKKGLPYVLFFLGFLFAGIWIFVLLGKDIWNVTVEHMAIARRNLFFPTGIFVALIVCSSFIHFFSNKRKKLILVVYIIMVGITCFDLFRFAEKFIPFTPKEYLFPTTETISFLQKNLGNYRFMTTNDQILPPNFSVIYRLQSVDGYDPLYLRRYAELISASERGRPDVTSPFGFNRIITPHNYDSKIIDLLGVKYILSLSEINSPKLKKVFQEGHTIVYENMQVLPRVFFVSKLAYGSTKEDVIRMAMRSNINLLKKAILEEQDGQSIDVVAQSQKPNIVYYSENKVVIETESKGSSFLVLTDSYYPTWHVTVDGEKTKIYRTDYNFRGLFVPNGKHKIVFYTTLL